MGPLSCVSCVSWMYWLNAAETHESFHQESGMRYQHSSGPSILSMSRGLSIVHGIRRTPIRTPIPVAD